MHCAIVSLLFVTCNMQSKVESTYLPDYYKIYSKADSSELSIKYFGIGSTLISYNGKAVFTDPALSNPSLFNVVGGKLKTDEALIRVIDPDLSQVDFTIVGHAHYDHLMDLPYLSEKYLPANSKIIASKTAANLLHAANLKQDIIDALPKAANNNSLGEWIYNEDKSIRILPIQASHTPQIANLVSLAQGTLTSPLKEVPERANQWIGGTTFTYLIDFLSADKSIEIRVYFQSTTDNAPSGMPNVSYLDDRKIDVALIAGGVDSKNLENTMNHLLAEKYVIIHWENFFRSKMLTAKPMSASHNKIESFIKEKGWSEKVIHPSPGQMLNF